MTTIDHTCAPGVLFGAALRGDDVTLLDESARTRPLAVWRWHNADESDRFVLSACVGPTLDVGCGPGRMTSELNATGAIALGIDVVPEAIDQTRARGAQALLRDVFEHVPGIGRWETVLLADGNVGIGGDPVRLLARISELLAEGGRVVVDVLGPGRRSSIRTHRLQHGELTSEPFPWAIVGIDQIAVIAEAAGLEVVRTEQYDERWFAILQKPAPEKLDIRKTV